MFYSHKKILVTGGASFIGSHLVDALVAADAIVTVVDDLSSGQLDNLQSSMHSISFIQGDLRDPSVADKTTKNQDIVFHLANIHGGRGFIDTHPGEIVQNFIIDGNVLYYANRNGVQRVCYTSSACAYPVNLQSTDKRRQEQYLAEEMADPFVEGAALADGEYGWGKLMGEMALKVYHKQYKLKGVSCRLFTVYGPRENESHAIIALIAKAFIRQDPYEIWGTGQQERNFTYVTDVVTGLLLAVEKIDDCRAINIDTNEVIKISNAATTVM
jgi:UDP-glucose 4-epimerase